MRTCIGAVVLLLGVVGCPGSGNTGLPDAGANGDAGANSDAGASSVIDGGIRTIADIQVTTDPVYTISPLDNQQVSACRHEWCPARRHVGCSHELHDHRHRAAG